MTTHHLRVAIYARVSSEQQAQEDTILKPTQRGSSTGASATTSGLYDPELRFLDDGVSGTLLLRPGLERLRDQAAAGSFDRLPRPRS